MYSSIPGTAPDLDPDGVRETERAETAASRSHGFPLGSAVHRAADLDSYLSPQAERLLLAAKARREARAARWTLFSELALAATFIVSAILVATLAHWSRPFSGPALGFSAIAYVIARRIRFPVGSAWTMPTQLVFVPMLFVLPTPLVPLVVAGCSLVDLWPEFARRRLSPLHVAGRVVDCFYSLGPVLVLIAFGDQSFAWHAWPVLLLAFLAQLTFDGTTGLARTWFAEHVMPGDQPQMLWLYFTDACLSCAGLAIAASAARSPGLILLCLPLFALLWVFASERQRRLDGALQLSSAYHGAATLLGDVIDAVDHYTAVHTRDVVELSVAVASAMGLDEGQIRDVEYAALLHDVGKIRIPAGIINKPGKLDDTEWAIMRQHTIEGESMLRQVGGTLAGVGRFVRSSHERYDGGGYPDGLTDKQIPIESRIVCVCDAYNAMTTDRPYRQARDEADALAELRRCSGSQFDPVVVEAFVALIESRSQDKS
jgi:HD-GYP domain-containing protein (c-di-GMP phosphodiesterase class II)